MKIVTEQSSISKRSHGLHSKMWKYPSSTWKVFALYTAFISWRLFWSCAPHLNGVMACIPKCENILVYGRYLLCAQLSSTGDWYSPPIKTKFWFGMSLTMGLAHWKLNFNCCRRHWEQNTGFDIPADHTAGTASKQLAPQLRFSHLGNCKHLAWTDNSSDGPWL